MSSASAFTYCHAGSQRAPSRRRTVSAMCFDSHPSKRQRLTLNSVHSFTPERIDRSLRPSKSFSSRGITDSATGILPSRPSPEDMPLSSEGPCFGYSDSCSSEFDLGLQSDSFSLLERSIEFGYPPVSSSSLPSSSPMGSSGGSKSTSSSTPKRHIHCSSSCSCIATSDTFGRNVDIDACQLVEEDTSPALRPRNGHLLISEFDNVEGMFIPKEQWGQFKATALTLDEIKGTRTPKGTIYQRPIGLGLSVSIYDEDLWADEQNPFLLRKEEIIGINRLQRKVLSTIKLLDSVNALLLEPTTPFFQGKNKIGLGISLGP